MPVGTLALMKARIASELRRSDLTTQIADAINDAIAEYQKERFRFSDIDPAAPPTFVTVAGQSVYGAAANPIIASLLAFDYLFIISGAQLLQLEQDTPENLHRLIQIGTSQGLPLSWAYEGNSIILYPVPNQVYTLQLGADLSIGAPATDGEVNNKWMTDCERLIRARAKFELATHVLRNSQMAEDMSPEPPPPGKATGHMSWRYWRSLKGEANRVTGRGRVKAMRF